MAKGYIICCGTKNTLTRPKASAQCYTNFRHYEFAGPGDKFIYGMSEPLPTVEATDLPYGIVEVEDFLERTLVPSFVSSSEADEKTFSNNLVTGQERAAAVASQWKGAYPSPNYGVAYVDRLEQVTPELLAKCRSERRAYAMARLSTLIKGMHSATLGRPGRSTPTATDEAWAAEVGKVLPTAAELLNDIPKVAKQEIDSIEPDIDLVPCPSCDEPIRPAAKKCRYCDESFGMPLLEYMTSPKATGVQ